MRHAFAFSQDTDTQKGSKDIFLLVNHDTGDEAVNGASFPTLVNLKRIEQCKNCERINNKK